MEFPSFPQQTKKKNNKNLQRGVISVVETIEMTE